MKKWILSLALRLRLKIDFWRLRKKMSEDTKKLIVSKVLNALIALAATIVSILYGGGGM